MIRSITAFAVLLAAAAPVRADVVELNANSGFDHDIAGVAVFAPAGGSAAWSATDLSGDAASGSLVLQGPPGRYRLELCLQPLGALPFGRQMFEFSARAQGAAHVLSEGIFEFGGDDPVHDGPCDGPWTAWLQHRAQSTVNAPTTLRAAIPTEAWPLLRTFLTIDKTDAGPMFVDDWSVSVDTDVIFRDDDPSAVVF